MIWSTKQLSELMPTRTGSVNPSKFEDETFELFSIPSYDVDAPEILKGKDIGSSKKLVQEGDVLLSKIVPHIRRCWVVGSSKGYRQIASGEWIIFRGAEVDKNYLKYFLLSDSFNVKFMSTIAGVGGSLMRARPSEVGKFEIPLPPIKIQKLIASALKKADLLRQQCQQMDDELNALAQSVFAYDVGDHHEQHKDWHEASIESLCQTNKGSMRTGPFGSDLKHSEFVSEGIAVIGIDNAVKNDFRWAERRFITQEKYERLKRYRVFPRDIIITIMGTVGRIAVVPKTIPLSISTKHLAVLTIDQNKALPEFVADALKWSDFVRKQIKAQSKGAIMDGLNLTIIKGLTIKVPPLTMQQAYLEKKRELTNKIETVNELQHVLDEQFLSLMQRAFKGELDLKPLAK